MKKILAAAIGSMLFISCHTQKRLEKSGDGVTVKIIQINDVYEVDALNNGKNGGLARVAYIKDSIKNIFPNTYYFLAGDFVNPSLLGTVKVDGERLQGRQMIEVLNAGGLDLVTFGNHEFDIKEADLQKRMNESDFRWTSANVRQVTSEGNKPFAKIQNEEKIYASDYEIYSLKTDKGVPVKFGVFGVTIPSNPKDFVRYGNIYDESVRAYHQASSESDFVLGLTHVTIEQDMEIARRLSDIPLIMGGHEHYNIKVHAGKTVITKADANALSLYLHTIKYFPKPGKLFLNSELIKVDDRYPSNSEVEKVVKKWTDVLEANMKTIIDNPNKIIYTAVEPLDGTDISSRSKQTNLGQIIGESMYRAVYGEADAVISNGGAIRIDDMLEGSLSSKDIFRILPFGGKILVVEMTGKLLKEILDYGVKATGTGAYLQRYLISKNSEGNWLIQDKELSTDRNYKVVLNDFLMQGLDVPFLTEENPEVIDVRQPLEDELASDIRKAIIHFLDKGKE